LAPLTNGAGFGFIVTLYGKVVATQPVAIIVSETCRDPTPAAPHVTVILLVPAPEVILPPTMDQAYAWPAVKAVLYTSPDWFAQAVTGPIIDGVGFGFTVTTLVPVNKVVQPVTGLVARTVMVVLTVSALLTRLIEPPVPATTPLTGVPPSYNW
jgi:hypothetical protein